MLLLSSAAFYVSLHNMFKITEKKVSAVHKTKLVERDYPATRWYSFFYWLIFYAQSECSATFKVAEKVRIYMLEQARLALFASVHKTSCFQTLKLFDNMIR